MKDIINNIKKNGSNFIVVLEGMFCDAIEVTPEMACYNAIANFYNEGNNARWITRHRAQIELLENIRDVMEAQVNNEVIDHQKKLDELKEKHTKLQERFSELIEALEAGHLKFREKRALKKELEQIHLEIVKVQSEVEAECIRFGNKMF